MDMSIVRKLFAILSPSERKSAMVLLGLTAVGMVFETFGLGLVVPATVLLLEPDLGTAYPRLRPFLDGLGNPSHATLVTDGMLILLVVYVIRTAFLAFLAWRQTRFAFNLQARLSEQIFAVYLHQPYTFHLHRNSAHLVRIAISEVSVFTFNCVLPGLALVTEILVLVGIGSLLLLVEPLGAVSVALVLGGTSWALQRTTRIRAARWGAQRQHHELQRSQRLQEGLSGAKIVKLLGRETIFWRNTAGTIPRARGSSSYKSRCSKCRVCCLSSWRSRAWRSSC